MNSPDRALVAPVAVLTYDGDERVAERAIPVETPVNLAYANMPFAVMMMTPADFEDFAIGFTITEGIASGVQDIRSVRVAAEDAGLRIYVQLAPDALHTHLARRRAISGRTGCGVCGIDDFDALPRAKVKVAASQVSLSAVKRALDALGDHQILNIETRAVHAAAWADADGALLKVREDVGRHNALDKLIGALLRDDVAPTGGFIVITSRCSFEMVEKAAAYGASTVVAISAPTSLALERAKRHDIALIALARRDSLTVFHGQERVMLESQS